MATSLQQYDDFTVHIPSIDVAEQAGLVGLNWSIQETGLLADFPEDYVVTITMSPAPGGPNFSPVSRTVGATVEGFYPNTTNFDVSDKIEPGGTAPLEFNVEAVQQGPDDAHTENRIFSVTYNPEGGGGGNGNGNGGIDRTVLLAAGAAVVGVYLISQG